MKKEILTSIALLAGLSSFAEEIPDSLKQIKLSEIIVSATRVDKGSPIAYSNMNAAEIKETNTAKNIPYILQTLPSVVAFSEDGSGVGNTSLRIRGTDATRINVTLNGMPLNNPESQEVYWVNIPDISNSLQNIQLQRGVGSSTNGTGAFGAGISLKTNGARPEAYGDASMAIGSYNTVSSTVAAGTGITKSGVSMDARFSRVTGDGYIRNGKVDHRSLYAALSYYSKNQLLRLSYINGVQHTGITWEGITPEQMEEDRRYNPAGRYKDEAGNVHYYNNETDNYYSDIVQLSYSNELNNRLSLNAGLSYNNGYGYYENYKRSQSFGNFELPYQIVNDSVHTSSDLVRRKAMKNGFYVANFTLNYTAEKVNLTGGMSYSYFDGDHFGRLIWVKFNENIPQNYEWYFNSSKKTDYNVFAKATYKLTDEFSLFGDIQYRYVDYRMDGIDDDLEDITNNSYYSFFNPKAGISYHVNGHEIYGSLAVANREPLRTDLKESVKGGSEQKINPERLFDYEAGYKFSNDRTSFNANLYYMYYQDQMVQTGRLNDVGYKLMENVASSYRAGIELIGAYRFTKWLRADANLTLSSNKIKNYTAYFDLYENVDEYYAGEDPIGQEAEYLGKTDISFSPNVIGSGVVSFTPKSFRFSLIGKYVGKQYLDNTSNDKRRLDDYFVANFVAGYTFKTKKTGEIDLQFFVNNIFNKEYVANGYADTVRFADGSPESTWIGLYPQATRNVMIKLGIRF